MAIPKIRDRDLGFPEKGAEEARAELPALLTAAEAGQTTLITRRGQPVAGLVPMATLRALETRQCSLLPLEGSGVGLWAEAGAVPHGGLNGGLREWLDDEALPDGLLLLVDTAPILHFLAGHAAFVQRFTMLFADHAMGRFSFAVTTLTLARVLRGPLRHGQSQLAARYRSVLATWHVVPVDGAVAARAASLCTWQELAFEDALTAASALEAGATALVSPRRSFAWLPLPVLC